MSSFLSKQCGVSSQFRAISDIIESLSHSFLPSDFKAAVDELMAREEGLKAEKDDVIVSLRQKNEYLQEELTQLKLENIQWEEECCRLSEELDLNEVKLNDITRELSLVKEEKEKLIEKFDGLACNAGLENEDDIQNRACACVPPSSIIFHVKEPKCGTISDEHPVDDVQRTSVFDSDDDTRNKNTTSTYTIVSDSNDDNVNIHRSSVVENKIHRSGSLSKHQIHDVSDDDDSLNSELKTTKTQLMREVTGKSRSFVKDKDSKLARSKNDSETPKSNLFDGRTEYVRSSYMLRKRNRRLKCQADRIGALDVGIDLSAKAVCVLHKRKNCVSPMKDSTSLRNNEFWGCEFESGDDQYNSNASIQETSLVEKPSTKRGDKRKSNLAVGGDAKIWKKTKQDVLELRQSAVQFMHFANFLKTGVAGNIEKVKAIRDIGFGYLLDLELPQHNPVWAAKLVDRFQVDTSSIILPSKEKVQITEDDVYNVYGIPKGPREVKMFGSVEENTKWSEFVIKMREYWNVKEFSPTMKEIVFILKQNEVDEEGLWIKNFVLLVVNTFMTSTKGIHLYYKFMFSIMEKESIKEINWCKYVHDSLLESVKEWKKKKDARFTGPFIFLMICYFDRVAKAQMKNVPRSFPLISVWNKERINVRMKLESESGFGIGIIMPMIGISTNKIDDGSKEMSAYHEHDDDINSSSLNGN